jgi:RNA polymerase sigma factor (sigma-70 family)
MSDDNDPAARRQIMRRSFDSYLATTMAYTECPEKIEEDRLLDLVLRLQAGDFSVSHSIIQGHMRLAMAIVADYANPRQSDDLVGEAMLRLTQAVEWCGGPKTRLHDQNITPYLASTMRSAVRNFKSRDRIFGMKARTLRNKKAKGEIDEKDFARKATLYTIGEEFSDILPITPIARRTEPDIALKEILQLAIRTDGERRVITLRAQGYSHTEIAPIMHLSIRRIGQLNADVEERFNALNVG